MAERRYVLLDRDGTVIEDRDYLDDPNGITFCRGALEGLRRLAGLGLGLIVVTNQSGIARGYFGEARLAEIHQRLTQLLASEGIRLDGIYHCPHGPDDGCACRKPLPGLVEQAARDHGFRPEACFVVGDKPSDVRLGQGVCATTFLVKTGQGARHAGAVEPPPDYVVDDLAGAAHVVHGLLIGDGAAGDRAG